MEALNFIKFWRTTTTNPFTTIAFPNHPVEKVDELEEEDEDSFFDLEITVYDSDGNKDKTDADPETNNHKEDKTMLESAERHRNPAKKVGFSFLETTLSLSPNDPISRRKILPIEPSSKPQSPIALLKSSPRFQVLMFKRPKSDSMPTSKTEKTKSKSFSMDTQKQKKQESKTFFTVKLGVDETSSSSSSPFKRANSLRKAERKLQDHQISESSRTERFSKEVIQKYLNLIKPLYVKVSKRYSEKLKFSEVLSAPSPSSSPATMALPKKKHLRKSKSASAAIGVAEPVNRRDDSLLQQHDGIQSAILHCKRSFNSSRDSSMSRSMDDSFDEKYRNSFSRDSSLRSQFANETSEEKSVKDCVEEGNGLVF
ncbi:membrane-associated kinase regulator 5 [Juglans microcarpa x Juglans regia]|uniref:membrane-associated kinase regulator 5 n=1 Tax=Juglans microcarpa x Juglans regia TaxID=2249226 RepID=UPI001B7F5FA7|nr:membrane-associated kinase regulator 5 [Juglans microcarpa x Juglans regia]